MPMFCLQTLDELCDDVIPRNIRFAGKLALDTAKSQSPYFFIRYPPKP